MLQSKNRTRKLRRQELANYKHLVKMLDTNLGLVTQRGLVWKRRYEQAEATVQKYSAQMMRERHERRSAQPLCPKESDSPMTGGKTK